MSWLVINFKYGKGGLWLNEIWTALARWVPLRLKEFGISVRCEQCPHQRVTLK